MDAFFHFVHRHISKFVSLGRSTSGPDDSYLDYEETVQIFNDQEKFINDQDETTTDLIPSTAD